MLGYGIGSILIMLIALIIGFFISVTINAVIYHIAASLLKFKKDFSTAFRMMMKVVGIYFLGVIIVGVIEGILMFSNPILSQAVMMVLNIILMLFMWYLIYYFGMKDYGLDKTQAILGVILFIVIGIILWLIVVLILGLIIFLIFGTAMLNYFSLMGNML